MSLDRNSTKIDIRRFQDLFYIVVAHMQSMDDFCRMRGNWKTIVPHANCHPSILKRSHDRLPSRYFICNHSRRMPEGFVFNTATDIAWSLLSPWMQHCKTRLCALNMVWCMYYTWKEKGKEGTWKRSTHDSRMKTNEFVDVARYIGSQSGRFCSLGIPTINVMRCDI